jgi:FKBP-type peptidyl-prolyl cis-trans isomerase FkpA
MKKLILFVISAIAISGYFGCAKSAPQTTPSCTATPVAQDSSALIKYAGDTISLTKDTSGLYYHIIDSGQASTKPQSFNRLVVSYVARLVSNNVTVDSAVNSTLNNNVLGDLIEGWQIGLPKIGVGGRIQLFIPSALAYGCTGNSIIPADAPMFFDIQLLQVN